MKNNIKIIMLAGNGQSTRFIYNGLSKEITIEKVLITSSSSKSKMIKRRIKRLGVFKVVNQLLFQIIIVNLLKFSSKNNIDKRIRELKLNPDNLPEDKIINVGFVNSKKTIETLLELNPDVILVNGTAIIGKKVLNSTKALFINTHVGITPDYRGVHGGYWALRNNDRENFGVTIHKIDQGIDTGDIIYQVKGRVEKTDNFLTYPLIQTALAMPFLKKTFEDIQNNQLKTYKKENTISKLYYHPGITTYLWGLIRYGIK